MYDMPYMRGWFVVGSWCSGGWLASGSRDGSTRLWAVHASVSTSVVDQRETTETTVTPTGLSPAAGTAGTAGRLTAGGGGGGGDPFSGLDWLGLDWLI